MSDRDLEVIVGDSVEEVAEIVAEELADAAAEGGHVALAGGSTPRRAYELAAAWEPRWHRAEVWWGDERCVPPDDPRSNFRMAREALLDRLDRPPAAVHRILGELGAGAAADRYDAELEGVRLHLVVLGIGADGHTASLFPGAAALGERERRAVAVAREDIDRVSLTPPVLEAAETVLFLAVGADKADAVARAFEGAPDPSIPASLIRSRGGRSVAVLDGGAAERLSP